MTDYRPMTPYDRAIATWIARHEKLDAADIVYVEFTGLNGCDTCGHGGGAALDYVIGGRSHTLLLDYPLSPGKMLEECVQILAEAGEIP